MRFHKTVCSKAIALTKIAQVSMFILLLSGCHKPFVAQIPIASPCNVQTISNDKIQIKDIQANFANLGVFIISTQNLQNVLKNGKNLKSVENLSFADFIATLSKADIILLGEKHDESAHHKAQLLIIAALERYFLSQGAHCNPSIAVVLEMLGSNAQNYIKEATQKRQDITKENLKTALGWEKWDYKQYKNILEYVFYSPFFEIVAGNLSREEISTIYKEAQELQGNLSTTQEVKDSISKIISKSHKTDDKALLNKLTKVQQYKDRRMADKLFASPHFAILLAGNYHITKTFGIPLHIADFEASNEALSPQNTINTKQVISIGMLKHSHLKSKKHRGRLLSDYDYILVFR